MPIYKKFSDYEVSVLKETFKDASYYPSKKKIKELAKGMRTTSLKIENWFKYNRRKLYFDGEFQGYKVRKTFNHSELLYLDSLYKTNKNPDLKECQTISSQMKDISGYQIKNWFANQRRKLKNNMLRNMCENELDEETLSVSVKPNKTKIKYKHNIRKTRFRFFSQIRSKSRKSINFEKNLKSEISIKYHKELNSPNIKIEENDVKETKVLGRFDEKVEETNTALKKENRLNDINENFNALQNNGTKVEWGSMAQSKITQPPLLQQFPLLFPQLSNQSSYFNCFNMKSLENNAIPYQLYQPNLCNSIKNNFTNNFWMNALQASKPSIFMGNNNLENFQSNLFRNQQFPLAWNKQNFPNYQIMFCNSFK